MMVNAEFVYCSCIAAKVLLSKSLSHKSDYS